MKKSELQKLIREEIILTEDLRAWFGKGKQGGVGGGGWDRYDTSGNRIGKCGDAKPGDPYSACLSKEKAEKLGKAGIAAFVKRKRAAQNKGGDSKKGGEHSKGQKPIKVKTGVKENIDTTAGYNKIDNLPKGSIFPDARQITGIFKKSKHTWSDVIESYEKNQMNAKLQDIDIKDIHVTQPNIQLNKVKEILDNNKLLTPINVVQFQDGEKVIYDGHHRLLAAWALDKPTIKVNLIKTGASNESILKEIELFLEKNIPTDKSKWSYYKSQAKKKFDVYPSAYANAWAAKMYKKAGGGWRKGK